ncbi:MAG TPA: hypothetical protein VEL79_18555 [Vicinamibacterales bacterium]|nr:hypothetical protein [Vicinamibacterales bacterium]
MDRRDAPMALMSVSGTDKPPTLEAAAVQLGVTPADLDTDYGIVLVDPRRQLYAVRVRIDRLPAASEREEYQGPFEDPAIGPLPSGDRRKSD